MYVCMYMYVRVCGVGGNFNFSRITPQCRSFQFHLHLSASFFVFWLMLPSDSSTAMYSLVLFIASAAE
jgi:hypothetical protein